MILAILNSNLITWYHHKRNPKSQKALFPKILVSDLKKLPLSNKINWKSLKEEPENEVEAFFANTFAEILDLEKVSVTDNFFEIGGTSLLVTKITMAAINRNYEVYYGDVFKHPTPRQLADFVHNGASANVSEESRYDYDDINALLKKNNLKSLANGEIADSFGDVLLTGATGFLGIHVLKQLLDSEKGNIYCFVRSRGSLSGEDRLKSLLFYYFSEDYSYIFENRLHVIEADITSFSDFEKMMSYNVDTIINCAANVKHFSSGTDIEDINLGGVINGLKFAKIKECRYVQVSTYSVAGLSINNIPPEDLEFTENEIYVGQNLDNAYLNSKFLAERAILEAAVEDDLDVKIMRAGNLMARSSDSEFQINYESNGFINRLKAFVNIEKMSYDMLDSPVEFSPIDITAKSIVELAKTPRECTVFHTYNPHNITFADVIEIIRNLNINIEFCEEEEYNEALTAALKGKTKQDALSGIITNVGEGQIKSKWLPVTNKYTIQALYRLGIVWPLIENEYVYNFIKHLNDVDFF